MEDRKKEPTRHDVWKMFNRIAPRYDLLNRLLSLRQDVAWRRKMARYLPDRPGLKLLDLATGTGDQILFLISQSDQIESAVGIDLAEEMLARGRQKVSAKGLETVIELKHGDATRIPFSDQQFDVITISFGIRNVVDVPQSLRDMYRVLKPGGRALILEFSLPANGLFRKLYLFYFRRILPLIGGLISGDMAAYRYLNQTVESFPYGRDFCDLMRDAGFVNVAFEPLTFSIAAIYRGDKR